MSSDEVLISHQYVVGSIEDALDVFMTMPHAYISTGVECDDSGLKDSRSDEHPHFFGYMNLVFDPEMLKDEIADSVDVANRTGIGFCPLRLKITGVPLQSSTQEQHCKAYGIRAYAEVMELIREEGTVDIYIAKVDLFKRENGDNGSAWGTKLRRTGETDREAGGIDDNNARELIRIAMERFTDIKIDPDEFDL